MRAKSKRPTSSSTLHKLAKLIGAIFLCEGVGILGAVFTTPSISTWYTSLIQPVFTPPNWIFGPAWTILYLLMGMSLYRAVIKRASLKWFVIQLALNLLWSYLFFGIHEIGLALVEIIVLLGAIFATIIEFRKKDELAAKLLVPYAGWVAFATLLNLSYWLLN